ncbi:MAG: hypothetical protein ACK486_00505 [Cyanobacteriota bacterium]
MGLLLILGILTRLLPWVLNLLLGSELAHPLERLGDLTTISNWLLLLPLGVALYFLGGGRQRLPKEFVFIELLHNSLKILGGLCLVLLPACTLHDVAALNQQLGVQTTRLEQLNANQSKVALRAAEAGNSAEMVALAKGVSLTLPAVPGESTAMTRWRLQNELDKQRQQELKKLNLINQPLYEQVLMSKRSTVTTILLQLITGVGLLLIRRQSGQQIKRHGLTPPLFFRVDPVRGGRK